MAGDPSKRVLGQVHRERFEVALCHTWSPLPHIAQMLAHSSG